MIGVTSAIAELLAGMLLALAGAAASATGWLLVGGAALWGGVRALRRRRG